MYQMLVVGHSQSSLKRFFFSFPFSGDNSLLLVYLCCVAYCIQFADSSLNLPLSLMTLLMLVIAANWNLVMETIDLQPLKKDGSDGGILPNVASHAPSKHNEKSSPPELSDDPEPGKSRGEVQMLNISGRPGSSVSMNSDGAAGTSSGPVLTPSSSMGSLSSEKSTLNPRAKVFFFCWTRSASLGRP